MAAPHPDTQTQPAIVKLRGITKTYSRGGEAVRVLDSLDLDVPAGSYEALMGPSGSCKTTLLNLIAGLDRPSSGSVEVAGKRLDTMGEGALAKWRSSTIGFVFQSYNLLPVLTALENVELPLLHEARERRAEEARADGPSGRRSRGPPAALPAPALRRARAARRDRAGDRQRPDHHRRRRAHR